MFFNQVKKTVNSRIFVSVNIVPKNFAPGTSAPMLPLLVTALWSLTRFFLYNHQLAPSSSFETKNYFEFCHRTRPEESN